MRDIDEVCRLMGAKPREVDSVTETPDGDVVTIRGYRTLIRPDGTLVHGVDEPTVVTVEEISEEDAQRIAAFVADPVATSNGPVDGPPDGPIQAVLAWVGEDRQRAETALAAELRRTPTRQSLISQLSTLLARAGATG